MSGSSIRRGARQHGLANVCPKDYGQLSEAARRTLGPMLGPPGRLVPGATFLRGNWAPVAANVVTPLAESTDDYSVGVQEWNSRALQIQSCPAGRWTAAGSALSVNPFKDR